MDFIAKIQALLDHIFYSIIVEPGCEQTSVSATAIYNEDRCINGKVKINTKVSSSQPDLSLFQFGMELGAGECGKANDAGVGKKGIVESNLHCPKLLKGMTLYIGSNCNNNKELLRSLQLVGITYFRKYRKSFLLLSNQIVME
ncbi:hypothetical protein BDC45DRAFT_537919 [Circinella umbellata]|nr:hypothetical protein BDC45DRAFT_537919 [Circinella umbellata]